MIIDVEFQPLGLRVNVASGTTVLEAAQRAGAGISAVCGGALSCGACRIHLEDQGNVSSPNQTEYSLLNNKDLAAGIRLACQTVIHSSLRVDIPPESLTAAQRVHIEGEESDDHLIEPSIVIHDVQLVRPDLYDTTADLDRISDLIGTSPLRCSCLLVLRQLPGLLRENNWRLKVVVSGDEIIHLAPPQSPILGLAIDIGTTKVAGYLVDMESGKTLAMKGIMNPQIAYGEDVMARIGFCNTREAGLSILHKVIVESLNTLSRDLCRLARENSYSKESAYNSTHIVETVVVGNTLMHHLLLGLPVEQLGLSPYIAAVTSSLNIMATEIGLNLSPGAIVHIPANIAGFVGADHLSMLLATDTHKKKRGSGQSRHWNQYGNHPRRERSHDQLLNSLRASI